MPIDSLHPAYQRRAAQWEKIRDVVAGSDAVKSRGARYLRRPEAMKPDQFEQYIQGAEFHAATGRTLAGLTGAIFRRSPVITVPPGFEPRLKSITPSGTPLVPFMQAAVREILATARYGVLVDIDADGAPVLAGYTSESIINWRTMAIDGRDVLVFVVLRETGLAPSEDDRFELEPTEQFRLLELARVSDSGSLHYISTVFQRGKGTAGFEIVSGPTMPARRGQALSFIPFVFINTIDLTTAIPDSPILGLTDTNLSHYDSSAALANGAWHTGNPMYVISGALRGESGDATGDLVVGPSTVWMLEKDGKAELLEFRGQGLKALADIIESKERHMAVLGARLLEDQKSGVEAAETVDMRHRGENSILATIAQTASRGFSKALSLAVWWSGGLEDAATVQLNEDFFGAPLNPLNLTRLVTSWQGQGIGQRVLFHNLKTGHLLPEDMTLEEYQQDVEATSPEALGLGFPDDDDETGDE